jgi:hypothetical protein
MKRGTVRIQRNERRFWRVLGYPEQMLCWFRWNRAPFDKTRFWCTPSPIAYATARCEPGGVDRRQTDPLSGCLDLNSLLMFVVRFWSISQRSGDSYGRRKSVGRRSPPSIKPVQYPAASVSLTPHGFPSDGAARQLAGRPRPALSPVVGSTAVRANPSPEGGASWLRGSRR